MCQVFGPILAGLAYMMHTMNEFKFYGRNIDNTYWVTTVSFCVRLTIICSSGNGKNTVNSAKKIIRIKEKVITVLTMAFGELPAFAILIV